VSGWLIGLSDVALEERHCLAEGDVVSYHFSMAGTHDGEFMGLPAIGNRIDNENNVVVR
jgi:predicted ester cyclase